MHAYRRPDKLNMKSFCELIDSYIPRKIFGNLGHALFQDNTAFERQSALFALAIADIILINM